MPPPPGSGATPATISSCVTVGGDLPESDVASQEWLERLSHLAELGIDHIVLDFGHPSIPSRHCGSPSRC